MVDVKNIRCKFCNTRAFYNYKNLYPAIVCAKHKSEDMVDIYSKRCEFESCNTISYFAEPYSTITRFCSRHKLKGMVNVRKR